MSNQGFTLIEMMITIAIAALLLTVAVPDFKDFIANNRLSTQMNTFVTALHIARAEAIKRSLAVTVCKSQDGKSCSDSKGEKGFEQGWIIFTDQQKRGEVDDGETIIYINQGVSSGMSLRCINGETKALCQDGEKIITFNPDGTSSANMTLRLCQQGRSNGRLMVINITGRTRVDPAEYKNCPT